MPGDEQKLVSEAYLRNLRCCGGFFFGTPPEACVCCLKRSAMLGGVAVEATSGQLLLHADVQQFDGRFKGRRAFDACGTLWMPDKDCTNKGSREHSPSLGSSSLWKAN